MPLMAEGMSRGFRTKNIWGKVAFVAHVVSIIVAVLGSVVSGLIWGPPVSRPKLRKVREGLWNGKGFTNNIENNITVVSLPEGLVVYNLLDPTEDLQGQLNALGRVTYLIAPSVHHDTHAKKWKAAYPSATLLVPRASLAHFADADPVAYEDVLPGLGFTIHSFGPYLMCNDLGHDEAILGLTLNGERIGFACDLVGNSFDMPVGFRVAGFYGLRLFRNFQYMFIRSSTEAKVHMRSILQKDPFTIMCFAHGHPVESNAAAAIYEVY